MKKLFLFIACGLLFAFSAFGQTKPAANKPAINPAAKNTAAYAELLLRKTELEADIEDFKVDYTEDYPKLQNARQELAFLDNYLEKILQTKDSDMNKLSEALGKLLLGKVTLETDLWALRKNFNADYPDVKRLQRKLTAYEKAVKEILP